MFKALPRSALAVVLSLSIFSTACTNNDLQSALNTTANLSQSAALAISGIQMDAGTRTILVNSLNALSKAAADGSKDLQAGPLTPQEITNLIAEFSTGVLSNNIPGVPPVALAAVTAAQAVAQIVIGLLQQQQTTNLALKSGSKSTKPAATTVSSDDMAKLKAAVAKYQTAVKTLQASK